MSSNIPFRKYDGEVPLWVTERKQLSSGEWVLTIWLATEDSTLSHNIHKAVKDVVNHMMSEAVDSLGSMEGKAE